MQEKPSLERATKDIELIKSVIERTNESMSDLSKTFIAIGLILLTAKFINAVSGALSAYIPRIAFISLSAVFSILILTTILYQIRMAYKIPLTGLSKKILGAWSFLFAFQFIAMLLNNLIVPRIFMLEYPSFFFFNQSISMLSLSSGLLILGVFADIRSAKIFSAVLAATGLYFMIPTPLTSVILQYNKITYPDITKSALIIVDFMVPCMITYIGYSLRRRKDKVVENGLQIDSRNISI